MSRKMKSLDQSNIGAMERDYWQQAQAARTLEDTKIDAEFRARRDGSRARLIELYNRKSQLQNELQSLEAGIAYQEQEQERLSHDYEQARSQLRARREDEDRRRHEWFTQAREEEAKRENGHAKTNGGVASGGEVQPNAAAVGGWTSINGSRRRSHRDEDEELPADPGNLLGSVYHNPVDEHETNGHGMARSGSGRSQLSSLLNDDEDGQSRKNGERPLKPKQRHSLPTFTGVVRSPVGKPGK